MIDVSIRMASPEETLRLIEYTAGTSASEEYGTANTGQCLASLEGKADQASPWFLWVAENGAQLAGMITISIGDDSARIGNFQVKPEFQRAGVGRALINAVLTECSRRGLTSIELDTEPTLEPIYWKLGFATVGYSLAGTISNHAARRMVRPAFEPALTEEHEY